MNRWRALLVGMACLVGCGQRGADTITDASTVASEGTSDQPASSAPVESAPSASTTDRIEVVVTTSTQPALSTTTIIASTVPPADGQLSAEPAESESRFVCAAVSLDGVSTRFCSRVADFIWSIGNRVFIFSAGPTLQLRDGRVLQAQPGTKYVIHEILNETVDNPQYSEPNFCSPVSIAEAFRRFDPSSSFGWGGNSCTSEEIFGPGTIPGVDEFGISEVLGGRDGTDYYTGFVARLNGVWTVLELVPNDRMIGCESVSVPLAKEVCDHSFSFKE